MPSLSELLYDIRRISEHREQLSEKRIQAIYNTLIKDLDKFLADGYKKYADDEGRFYISYLDAQNQRAKFLQEIVDNVDNISPQIKKEVLSLIDETYSTSYEGMSKSFKKAHTKTKFEDITKDIAVNPNVLKQAVNNNISKLTLTPVLEKHRQDIIYQIQQELNIGLMQGDRYEKMAKRITEKVGFSRNKAMNIVRTETHRNIESGFMDCAEHIQEKVENSNLIYAATWRTMKDERVRPFQRKKTKKGWVTTISKNGANHQKMEGVTVKAGELFDLGDGNKTKAPSQSGVAAHDCNCRCFLEYNLMTVEEFAKATGKKVEKVIKRPNIFTEKDESVEFLNNINNYDVSTNPKRRKLAKQTLDELGLGEIPVSVKKIQPNGYCKISFKNLDTTVYEYVLDSNDMREDVYKIKTMFHEAYHAKSQGGMNDVDIIGIGAWTDIEEIFAETSAHYIMQRAGFTQILAPSYADKFAKVLPRMKQLDDFKDFETIYEFGKFGWNNRVSDKKAIWGNYYGKVSQIKFDWKKYVNDNYIQYIDDNIDSLLDSMLENMPQYKRFKGNMLQDYKEAKQVINNGGKLTGNQEMVLTNLVANAMMKVGVK